MGSQHPDFSVHCVVLLLATVFYFFLSHWKIHPGGSRVDFTSGDKDLEEASGVDQEATYDLHNTHV